MTREQQDSPTAGGPHIAVIGAGIAGLACARELAASGARASVFERGRRAGGRLSSHDHDGGTFDIGAQYLTVHNEDFAKEVHRWASADVLRSWDPRLVELANGQMQPLQSTAPRFVGAPTMQSIADFLGQGLKIQFGASVAALQRDGAGWRLRDRDGHPLGAGAFDAVVLALPSADALPLLEPDGALAARVATVQWDACWSAMLALSRPSGIEFGGAFINDDPILAWAACENSKPGRPGANGVAERWVLHARSSWSNNFIDLPADDAARWMQRAFAARLARPLAQKSCVATCWRHAIPVNALPEGHLWDAEQALGLAGDWFGGARVEHAFLSGYGLARAIAA